jgi:hypothetical protein
MSTKNKILQIIASKAGWQGGLVTKDTKIKPTNEKLAYRKVIAENSFNKETLNIDAVYFNDISPIIYIKEISSINNNEINQIQNKFWNESRTPFALIITPVKIYLLNNFSANENKIIIDDFNIDELELNRLATILKQSNVDSENIFIGNEKIKIEPKNRIDKKLIQQLHEARKLLVEEKKYKLSISTIHNLLGRALFTFYLEHREILTTKEIKIQTGLAKKFDELLTNHPKETYVLFEFLKVKFNGDLFPVNAEELNAVEKYPQILQIVADCFTGLKMLGTNQLSAFPLFNFKYIPIELISAIYEEFMSNEVLKDGELILNEKKSDGAFYTPQMLVEFTYNEVLPMPTIYDNNYDFKILDPTCGSGIFLVEGFKRLIERWKFANPNKNITPTVLKSLLYNNIFGIEKNPEATKVTAFSLYLTFLNYMNPRKVLDEVHFNNLIYWTDEKEANYRIENEIKFGKNILQANTFIRETTDFKNNPNKEVTKFFNTPFNLIIGNPPWKRSNVDDEIKKWAKENNWNVNKDIVKAFIAYAPTINPNAKVALITSAKSLLFNTENPDIEFRQKLYKEFKISTIVNFSVVRDVLFEQAKQAGALIIYENRNTVEPEPNETILYCVPQKIEIIKSRRTIVIDETEIKFLPISELEKPNSKLYKIAMFGGLRDLRLINKINKTISIYDGTRENERGIGLKKKGENDKKQNTHLVNSIFIPTEKITQYYIPKIVSFETLNRKAFYYRFNDHHIFKAPFILINEGSKNSDLCITFFDYDATYPNSAYGVSIESKSLVEHKALTVILNSKIAKYFYLSISSSWGIDRQRIINREAISFPLLINTFSTETINTLASHLDQIIEIKKADNDNKLKKEVTKSDTIKIEEIKKDIDKLIYKELKISKYEKALIDNVINYSNVIKDNYTKVKAEDKIDTPFITHYATAYADVINNYFKHSEYKIKIETFTQSIQSPLAIIKCTINKKNTNTVIENNADIQPILEEINQHTYQQYTSSIYFRKTIEYQINKNTFYFIKPNQRKFWNIAQALNDADSLIVKLLNQNNN